MSRYTIRNWLSTGRLRRVKIGSRTFVDPAELRQFVERAKQASGEKESAVEETAG